MRQDSLGPPRSPDLNPCNFFIGAFKTANWIPGLAAIASRRGKSSAITNVHNDE
jgi:hypothetical protein